MPNPCDMHRMIQNCTPGERKQIWVSNMRLIWVSTTHHHSLTCKAGDVVYVTNREEVEMHQLQKFTFWWKPFRSFHIIVYQLDISIWRFKQRLNQTHSCNHPQTHVHVITNREEEREEGKRDKERREGDVNVKQYQLVYSNNSPNTHTHTNMEEINNPAGT